MTKHCFHTKASAEGKRLPNSMQGAHKESSNSREQCSHHTRADHPFTKLQTTSLPAPLTTSAAASGTSRDFYRGAEGQAEEQPQGSAPINAPQLVQHPAPQVLLLCLDVLF